jgi:hypothetical protein
MQVFSAPSQGTDNGGAPCQRSCGPPAEYHPAICVVEVDHRLFTALPLKSVLKQLHRIAGLPHGVTKG